MAYATPPWSSLPAVTPTPIPALDTVARLAGAALDIATAAVALTVTTETVALDGAVLPVVAVAANDSTAGVENAVGTTPMPIDEYSLTSRYQSTSPRPAEWLPGHWHTTR